MRMPRQLAGVGLSGGMASVLVPSANPTGRQIGSVMVASRRMRAAPSLLILADSGHADRIAKMLKAPPQKSKRGP